jgi:hypothetical protein
MKINILFLLLILLFSPANLYAEAPTYPILIEEIPNQPNIKATFRLTDGTTLDNLLILSNNEETDPGSLVLRFFRPPLKSSIYIRDLKAIEFEKTEGEKGLSEGDNLKLTLKNGKSDMVEYISGLNDGFTVIYQDDFSGYHQKLYIPLYQNSAEKSDLKKLHIKEITFL